MIDHKLTFYIILGCIRQAGAYNAWQLYPLESDLQNQPKTKHSVNSNFYINDASVQVFNIFEHFHIHVNLYFSCPCNERPTSFNRSDSFSISNSSVYCKVFYNSYSTINKILSVRIIYY